MKTLLVENEKQRLIKITAEELLKGIRRRIALIKIIEKRACVSEKTVKAFLQYLRKKRYVVFTREFLVPTPEGLIYFSNFMDTDFGEIGDENGE